MSSALLLSIIVGCLQLFLFTFGARQILGIAGINESSIMFSPALAYMKIRALAAPVATMWLVATNIFRGRSHFVMNYSSFNYDILGLTFLFQTLRKDLAMPLLHWLVRCSSM